MGRKVFTEIQTKQTMNRVTAPSMPFHWSINPYRGCSHGCSFCYARSTHTFLGMSADDTFQNHIILKTNAPEALQAQLEKTAKRFKGDLFEIANHIGLVAIGTATDPYQPVEAKQQLTRECLKILAKYRIPTTITTRSPLILRDLDIVREMHIASINISINTLNRDVWRRFEPATSFPLKRFETVGKLSEHNIHTGIFMAPILPFITDGYDEMESIMKHASQYGAKFVMPSILRLAPEVKGWFFKSIAEHYPELMKKYEDMYRSTYPSKRYVDSIMKLSNELIAKHRIPGAFPERDDWRESWLKHQKLDNGFTGNENNPQFEQLSLF